MPKKISLICFDIDGTLIDDEGCDKTIWSVLQSETGVSDLQRHRDFQRYESGDWAYGQWVESDFAHWRESGLTLDRIEELSHSLSLMPGTRNTIFELERRGYLLGIISSSVDIGIKTLFPDHPFRIMCVNQLFFDEAGHISGWDVSACQLEGKGAMLAHIAEKEGISVEQCGFVGDSFNDVGAARMAGRTVAINSKSEELNDHADVVIHGNDLSKLLEAFE